MRLLKLAALSAPIFATACTFFITAGEFTFRGDTIKIRGEVRSRAFDPEGSKIWYYVMYEGERISCDGTADGCRQVLEDEYDDIVARVRAAERAENRDGPTVAPPPVAVPGGPVVAPGGGGVGAPGGATDG
ncbi:hypothetical protein [Pseudooceanicola sp. MF1-13]|uniref:hypothetical protein n=1 Tax=Pseudooceanicola sp. MF1-13 TaxID=3379095 RepID=UPI0038914ED5